MSFDSGKAHEIMAIAMSEGCAGIEATRRGLPISTVDELVDSGRLSLAEIDKIVIPRKTLAHRRAIGALARDQSDRLMRVVRVIAAAENTFGSLDKAYRWPRRPTTALEGDAPLALLDTSEGSRQVERLLARIDNGLTA